ncbi:hypothetical protein CKAN_00946000 [Cinnamomum micranthum f. kanehirae]|uniref:Uncharacterized protein n=1 Tax=Cinnamomum micranthum f. kanehirae TaxID=337451 RepID=A0A3S3MIV8_9MAGN|nr:hypothetical protein CKAN_00946000 [Cinnamomum micranthum f. kanehirae]
MNSSSSLSASLSSITILHQPPLASRLSYHHRRSLLHPTKNLNQRKKRSLRCRADLSQDAPFALAIGSCVLNSLIFPVTSDGDDGDADGGSGINSTDTRFAVMGIISFIPYFNWLSWIFAWLDTGRQRYLVYSIVYLAPYLRQDLWQYGKQNYCRIGFLHTNPNSCINVLSHKSSHVPRAIA